MLVAVSRTETGGLFLAFESAHFQGPTLSVAALDTTSLEHVGCRQGHLLFLLLASLGLKRLYKGYSGAMQRVGTSTKLFISINMSFVPLDQA